MKKFIKNFVFKYEDSLRMRSLSKNRISRHFYLKNVLIVVLIGYLSLVLIGSVFNLLENKSFVFYGMNAIVFVSIFLFVYSKEMYVKSDCVDSYNLWYIVMNDLLYIYDSIIFLLVMFFMFFGTSFFSGIEGVIFYSVSIIYLLVSGFIKKSLASIFSSLPMLFIFTGSLIVFESYSVIIQYSAVCLITFGLFVIKQNIATEILNIKDFTTVFVLFVVAVVIIITVKTDDDFTTRTYKDGVVLEEINFGSQYFHFAKDDRLYFTDRGLDKVYSVYIYNMSYELITTLSIENDEYKSIALYENPLTIRQEIDDETDLVYQISNSDELVLLGEFDSIDYQYEANVEYKGMTSYSNDGDYYLFFEDNLDAFFLYHKIDETYELEFQLDSSLKSRYGVAYTVFVLDDYYLIGITNTKSFVILDKEGYIVSSYNGEKVYRGTETIFNVVDSSSSYPIYDVFYNDYINEYLIWNSEGMYAMQQILIDNINVTGIGKNRTNISYILLLSGLAVPIWRPLNLYSKKNEVDYE